MYKEIPIKPAGGDIRVELDFPTLHFVGYKLTLRQGQYSYPIGIGDNEQIDEEDRFLLPGPVTGLIDKKLWCTLVIRRTPKTVSDQFEVRLLIAQGDVAYPPISIADTLTQGEAQRIVILKFVEAQ